MGIHTSTILLASVIIVSFGAVESLLTPYEVAVGLHKMIKQPLCKASRGFNSASFTNTEKTPKTRCKEILIASRKLRQNYIVSLASP
jgi:hypothetical protein